MSRLLSRLEVIHCRTRPIGSGRLRKDQRSRGSLDCGGGERRDGAEDAMTGGSGVTEDHSWLLDRQRAYRSGSRVAQSQSGQEQMDRQRKVMTRLMKEGLQDGAT